MTQKQQLKDSEYHRSKRNIKKIINAARSFRDRCIIKILAEITIRWFELADLDIRDVDFEHRLIYIREGKGGKSRTIPVSEELLRDLRHLLGSRKKGPVFTNPRGISLQSGRLTEFWLLLADEKE